MSDLTELTTTLDFEVKDEGLHKLHERLEGLHKTVERIAALEVAKAIFELAERFSSLGESLESAAVAAGVSTDNLQRLQYAASQNAVGTEELNGALARLSRTLYAAQRGSKQAIESFGRIGIGEDQLKGFTNAEDAFYAVQDAINSTATTATQKIGLIQAFFGRGASRMAKFINIGSNNARELGRQATEMGAVVSEAGVHALADLEDKVSGAKLVFRAFMANLGATFAPAFIQIIEGIEKAWVQNQESIKANVRSFAWYTLFAFGAIYESVRLVASSIIRFAREHPLITEWGVKAYLAMLLFGAGMEVVIGAINIFKGAWTAFSYLPWFIGILRSIWVWMTAIAVNPLFLEIAASVAIIAAMVLYMQLLYTWLFKGGSFKDSWLGQLLSSGGSIASAVGKWMGFGPDNPDNVGGTGPAKDAIAAIQAPQKSFLDTFSAPTTSQDKKSGASMWNMLSAVQGIQVPAPSFAGMPAQTMPTGPESQLMGPPNVKIDAPITINVPPGMTPDQASDFAHRGVKKSLVEVLNEAQRSFATARYR